MGGRTSDRIYNDLNPISNRVTMKPYELLEGSIDLHIHAGPDLFPRDLDESEVAQQAEEIGMRAILLKSHFTTNADRISVLRKNLEDWTLWLSRSE